MSWTHKNGCQLEEKENKDRFFWTTKDGRQIAISNMTVKHIKNTLAMLERKGYIKTETLAFYLTCPLPRGDGAMMCFDHELEEILERPTTRYIKIFEDELEKRGVKNEI